MKNFLLLILFAFVKAMVMATDTMSSTKLVEARAYIPEMLEKEIEGTKVKSELINALLGMANSSQATIEGEYQEGRTIKVGMLLAEDITVNTARTCAPTGNQPTSATATITPFTATGRFTLSKTQANVNDIVFIKQLARKLFDAERAIFFGATNGVDAKILASLITNTSAVNLGNGSDGTLTSSVMELEDAQKVAFYSLLNSHMNLNNLDSPFTLVSNTHWRHTFAKASGFIPTTNSVDEALQYGIKQLYSNSLTPATGFDSKHFLIKDGAMGLVSLTDRLYLNSDPNWKAAYYRTVIDSVLFPGIKLMLKETHTCANTSAVGGQLDDDTVNYEIAYIGGVYHAPSTLKRVYQYATKPSGIV